MASRKNSGAALAAGQAARELSRSLQPPSHVCNLFSNRLAAVYGCWSLKGRALLLSVLLCR